MNKQGEKPAGNVNFPIANILGWAGTASALVGVVVMIIEAQSNKHGLALIFYTAAFFLKHVEVVALRKELKRGS